MAKRNLTSRQIAPLIMKGVLRPSGSGKERKLVYNKNADATSARTSNAAALARAHHAFGKTRAEVLGSQGLLRAVNNGDKGKRALRTIFNTVRETTRQQKKTEKLKGLDAPQKTVDRRRGIANQLRQLRKQDPVLARQKLKKFKTIPKFRELQLNPRAKGRKPLK